MMLGLAQYFAVNLFNWTFGSLAQFSGAQAVVSAILDSCHWALFPFASMLVLLY